MTIIIGVANLNERSYKWDNSNTKRLVLAALGLKDAWDQVPDKHYSMDIKVIY